MTRGCVFNLGEIRSSLLDVYKHFDEINASLENKREPMTLEIVEHILLAYEYLNTLLAQNIDLFSPAGMYSMLELNHIVLCGKDPAKRFEFHSHILSTRERFQKRIGRIIKWYKDKGKKLPTLRKAAQFYTLALSQPQLFIEGNHRTGNIVMNYLLVGDGVPPFILTVENAQAYFNPSARIKYSDKDRLFDQLTQLGESEESIYELLKNYGNSRYVVLSSCLEGV
jgi:prophage maintenance system killer protein